MSRLPVDLPSPEEYGRRLAARRAKVAKVPDMRESFATLSQDLAAQRESVEALLGALVAPDEVPVDEILSGLSSLSERQRQDLEQVLTSILQATNRVQATYQALLDNGQQIAQTIQRMAQSMARLPREFPAPQKVDISNDVGRILDAISATGASVGNRIEGQIPQPRAPIVFPLQLEVTDRDKSGAIKKIKVTGA